MEEHVTSSQRGVLKCCFTQLLSENYFRDERNHVYVRINKKQLYTHRQRAMNSKNFIRFSLTEISLYSNELVPLLRISKAGRRRRRVPLI